MTVYGYLRVSTDKQDCANQKIGVERLAEQRRLPIDSWIVDDGVSGTKEPHKRKLGRPRGSTNKRHIWDGKERLILSLSRQGIGAAGISRATGISVGTIYSFLKQKKLN